MKGPKRKDLTDRIFERWTVLNFSHKSTENLALYWNCKCSCGVVRLVSGSSLTQGRSKSCGCLHRETISKQNFKHGWFYTPEYKVWHNMKIRCFDKNNPGYSKYGGRGISVCSRWLIPENFFEDMGKRPSPEYSLDRIDNNKDYSPENCRWATRKEQMRNTRRNRYITWNDALKTISEVSEITGVCRHYLRRCLNRGLSIKEAVLNYAGE